MAQKNPYEGQPVFFSEFGGIAMKRNINNGNWGANNQTNDLSVTLSENCSYTVEQSDVKK